MKKNGLSSLKLKIFSAALVSYAALNSFQTQQNLASVHQDLTPNLLPTDTLKFFAPKSIVNHTRFKFLFQGDYKLISETNDTITLQKFQNFDDNEIPVQIVIEREKKDQGRVFLLINSKKYDLELLSDFSYKVKNGNVSEEFHLKLNTGGDIHRLYKAGHKSHMSHYSHYSHRSQISP